MSYSIAHSLIMAALVQLFAFLFLLLLVAAEFPVGPAWEWVSGMVEMRAKEFGEVSEPLIKMNRNALLYPEITPIQGWALSAKVEPLWQAEGEGANALALVYEEVEVEVEARAVIAFRGHAEGNMIDSCATALLAQDRNTTLVSWCYATYNASTMDYYSQAVAYTMRTLEAYQASSVLLTGTSMGGFVVDLVAAGVLTDYMIALPVVAFESGGHRGAMHRLGISLQDHYTSIIGVGHQWDPYISLHWDDRLGTVCLFPAEKPSICNACFADTSNSPLVPSLDPTSLQEMSQDCHHCASSTHDSFLLLDMMLEGVNPICYLIEDTLLPLAVAEYTHSN